MQDEYDELGQQMSDMLQNTAYGGTNLFGVSGTNNTGTDGLFQSAVTFQVGAESSDTMTVNISSQLNTLVTTFLLSATPLVRIRLTPLAPQWRFWRY